MSSSNFWPGTNIPKSRGNAFDWRGRRPSLKWHTPNVTPPKPSFKAFGTGPTIQNLRGKKQ